MTKIDYRKEQQLYSEAQKPLNSKDISRILTAIRERKGLNALDRRRVLVRLSNYKNLVDIEREYRKEQLKSTSTKLRDLAEIVADYEAEL